MLLIVDTNILFAATLKNSTIRKILLTAPIDFVAPEYAFQELEDHIDELSTKNKLSREENMEIIKILKDNVGFVRAEDCVEVLDEALEIMKDIDPDDAPIIAAALTIHSDGIWSDDPHLREQSYIKVWITRDLTHFVE